MTMIPISLNSLLSSVLGEDDASTKAREIIDEAVGRGLSGERLHFSLVYSGMSLGVNDVEHRFEQATAALAAAYREIVGELQKAIPLVDDTTALSILSKLKDEAETRVTTYGKYVADIYAKQAMAAYGIEEAFFTSGKGTAFYTPDQLALVGYSTSTRAPAYFAAWLRASREFSIAERFPEGKCRCMACLHEAVFKGRQGDISRDDELKLATQRANLDGVFAGWAAFLLDTLQEKLMAELSGGSKPDHEKAESVAKTLLDSLLKDPGKLPPEDA